ncbi:MAG: matrixin family metalloprotease [Thermoplasmata archaeon]|nr:MAG: matrixin family metalloprotease [Thermoplasmata archaeon]
MNKVMKWVITIVVLTMLTLSFSIAASLVKPVNDADAKVETGSTEPMLEKRVHIMYDENYVKPDNPGKPDKPPKPDEGPDCYGFLSKGMKWRSLPIDLYIDDNVPAEIDYEDFYNAVVGAAGEWDSHTNDNIFGNYHPIDDGTWDDTSAELDDRNEILFGDYPTSGVIAVCITWGYYTGPPSSRAIIEFDIMFDIDFTWGDGEANPNVMDLLNIAVHEIGHGLGLEDQYDDACSEATMYGYSGEGDIHARDLWTADITGIQQLYGAI